MENIIEKCWLCKGINHIKVVDGKFYEHNEDYFAEMGLAPDGRPLPDDKFEPVTFGDR